MSAPIRRRPPGTGELLALARQRQERFLTDLAELVAIDSGSYSPHGVNRVADWTEARLRRTGFDVERVTPAAHPARTPGEDPDGDPGTGDVLVARKPGRLPRAAGGRRLLLAAHMDTVFADGTAAARPFEQAGGLALGPGVSDDKGGLLAGLTAIDVLAAAGHTEFGELVFLATPDEEIGSPASRPVSERTARDADYALALECARENGDVVIARKGVADFRITVTGRAAHAGIEPERGANAALAAAHLVVDLEALNRRWEDVSLNVGVVRAGDRTNIVCPRAHVALEVRSLTTSGLRRAAAAIRETAARLPVPGTHAEVEQLDLCPPMEATPASHAVLDRARALGRSLGLELGAATTGGVGDANLFSGVGVPTLDGLGPVGGADHTPDEWLLVSSVPERVALLAALIADLGDARPA
ncbi:M20/M25/M40 family metallo-hydrolase [Streptomyces sp. WMMC897]|uniref:M20/M25/M40 family metallo-hydrolase n=1 Tax=Streptomyces sp. WMMC897 TaxID=3014782 RepID=UPI0022B6DEC7|nr:M20/M25/M40 family metallo-hydrolase [Streptomyces sp. WMMC897]MCZ7415291.1 M20/M25/M40 family metallo-hydrolase [Streptomyces sp. WMMC897]